MKRFLSFTLLLFSCQSYGLTLSNGQQTLDIKGYLGYRYIGSTQPQSVVNSDPEAGLLLNLQLSEEFSVYTQFAYDEKLESSLAYSFLAYDKQLTQDFAIGFKAGKLRHQYGLYNETRLNPRTRQGVIMPQAIYWDSLNHFLISGEGVNANLKFKNLSLSYTIDNPEIINSQKEAKMWSYNLLSCLETSFGSHQIAAAKYSFDTIPLKLAGSWAKADLGDNATAAAFAALGPLARKHQANEGITLGFEYDYDKSTFSGEALAFKAFYAKWNELDKLGFGTSYTINYELTDSIKLYTNYNNYYNSSLVSIPKWQINTTDVNMGLNYHKDDWMIGAEIHHINGDRWVNPSDEKDKMENIT